MLSSLFSFSLTNFYSLFYLKQVLFRLKHSHELSELFVSYCIDSEPLIPVILQTSVFKSTAESFWGSMWFTCFVVLYSYLYSFQKQVSASFIIEKATTAFLVRETLVITTTNLLDLCINCVLKASFWEIFAALKECFIIITNKTKNFCAKLCKSKNCHRCEDINKSLKLKNLKFLPWIIRVLVSVSARSSDNIWRQCGWLVVLGLSNINLYMRNLTACELD